jgi:hypothetical protein
MMVVMVAAVVGVCEGLSEPRDRPQGGLRGWRARVERAAHRLRPDAVELHRRQRPAADLRVDCTHRTLGGRPPGPGPQRFCARCEWPGPVDATRPGPDRRRGRGSPRGKCCRDQQRHSGPSAAARCSYCSPRPSPEVAQRWRPPAAGPVQQPTNLFRRSCRSVHQGKRSDHLSQHPALSFVEVAPAMLHRHGRELRDHTSRPPVKRLQPQPRGRPCRGLGGRGLEDLRQTYRPPISVHLAMRHTQRIGVRDDRNHGN